MATTTPANIVMADDDLDDCLLVEDALKETGVPVLFRSVENGEYLLAYLNHEGNYADTATSPRPDLILLDLNMPRKNGWEILKELKKSSSHKDIPVVVLTTSKEEKDIARCYELGANSFLTKSADFTEMVNNLRTLTQYWFRVVRLPLAEKKH